MSFAKIRKNLHDANSGLPENSKASDDEVDWDEIDFDDMEMNLDQPDKNENQLAKPNQKPSREWEIGDNILDTFTVLDIKAGGMGRVYIAENSNRKQKVAIKVPNENMLSEKTLFARVVREAQQWIDLGLHPHIAYCYYVRQINDIPHIFIEYVDGGNLRDWIRAERFKKLKVGLDVAIQFCHGMEYAQQFGMVHRDIKPENVLMTANGTLKITDFGLARMTGGAEETDASAGIGISKKQEQLTMIGQKGVGTAAYMAPEQYLDLRSVDTRADIYSFGVCLYEMFCGCRPFEYESREVPPSILAKYQGHKPADPRTRRPDIPENLAALLERCCALDKGGRYQSFLELRQDLEAIYRDLFQNDSPHAEIMLTSLKADGLNNRGASYWDLGREEDARLCWEEALKADPQHLEATFNLGYMKWHKAEMGAGEFLTRLKNIESVHKNNQDYWHCLAWTYYEQGYCEDIEILQKSSHAIKDENFLKALEEKNRAINRVVKIFKGHTKSVTSACFSPDGKYALTGSEDKSAILWDLKYGKAVHHFEGHADRITTVAFSPDVRYVLTGSEDNTSCMWDIESGNEIYRLKGGTPQISSDNQYILTQSPGRLGSLLWDVEAGQEWEGFEGNDGCFSPDGRYVLTISPIYYSASLWETETGREVRKFEGHTSPVLTASFSPNGLFVLTGSKNNTSRLWDTETGENLQKFEGVDGCFSPDSRYVMTKRYNGAVTILSEISSGKMVRQFKRHSNNFSPNGRLMLTRDNDFRTLSLRETENWRELRCSFEQSAIFINNIPFSPDGNYILVDGLNYEVKLIEYRFAKQQIKCSTFPLLSGMKDGIELNEENKKASNHFHNANMAAECNDWKLVNFLANKIREVNGFERDTRALDLLIQSGVKGKGVRRRLRDVWPLLTLEGHEDGVVSSCFSPDDRYVLTGSSEVARLWDARSGQEIQKFATDCRDLNTVNFSPNGKYLLTGNGRNNGEWNSLRMWNVESGQEVRRFSGHTWGVAAAVFSPCGRYILSGGNDNVARIREVDTGKELTTFVGHANLVKSVCFSPDGRYVLTGSADKTVRLWDNDTGRELRQFSNQNDPTTAACFSPDGQHLLTGGGEIIRLWETSTGREVRRLLTVIEGIPSFSFSPDGRYAIAGSWFNDRYARLIDIESAKEVWRCSGHSKAVLSVCFSSNGRYVLTGSREGSAKIWELDWEWEFPKE